MANITLNSNYLYGATISALGAGIAVGYIFNKHALYIGIMINFVGMYFLWKSNTSTAKEVVLKNV
ncbi:MAG: hypothetical protein AABY22_07390 [Nanoarchaeota archaeon]